MPFCGGQTPGPWRCGGGTPRLTRIIESLQAARGPLFTTNPATVVGVENNAIARVLDRDNYGTNERMANSFLPSMATDLHGHGTLRRWEAIFGIVASPKADEPTRRAAVSAAWTRIFAHNNPQGIADALTPILGPLFVGIVNTDPATGAVSWWPQNPLANSDPNVPVPWYSTVLHIAVQVQQPAGYTESQFLTTVGAAMAQLDWLLPSYCTFDWFTVDTGAGVKGFYLDSYENLLRDVFDV